MRYKLPLDLLVNQLVPHFLSGRKLILFIQSLVYPLASLNQKFVAFAKDKHIEARMTSQKLYFEWFLNYKLGEYIADKDNKITIENASTLGIDLYPEKSFHDKPFTIWYNLEEAANVTNPQERPRSFYLKGEEKDISKVSFIVHVPTIQIPAQEFVYMLSYWVNLYKLAGKTYLIKIQKEEYEPNYFT